MNSIRNVKKFIYLGIILVLLSVTFFILRQPQHDIVLQSNVNVYESVVKNDYLEKSNVTNGLPRYVSPCRDEVLNVLLDGVYLSPQIDPLHFGIFRTEDSLILIGKGCNNEGSIVKPGNLYAIKYNLINKSHQSEVLIIENVADFKITSVNQEVFITTIKEDILHMRLDPNELTITSNASISIYEYEEMEQVSLFNNAKMISYKAPNGIVLRAMVAEVRLNFEEIPYIK